MYEHHFGLRTLPFGITPDPAFFFGGNARGDLLAALRYAVAQGAGIVKLTGAVGSGKTMLCRMLEAQLPAHIDAIYLPNPTLRAREVAYAIGAELGLPTHRLRLDEMLRLLHEDLIRRHAAGRQVVLLIEEAQAMPLATLEEVRLLSNLETTRHKLLQIVLFGQPELDRRLARPEMRQLRERIAHQLVVPPLAPGVLPAYLDWRLRAAGHTGPELFAAAAVRTLAHAADGIIRRVNVLADQALLAAYVDDAPRVQLRHARAAVREAGYRLRWSGAPVAAALRGLLSGARGALAGAGAARLAPPRHD